MSKKVARLSPFGKLVLAEILTPPQESLFCLAYQQGYFGKDTTGATRERIVEGLVQRFGLTPQTIKRQLAIMLQGVVGGWFGLAGALACDHKPPTDKKFWGMWRGMLQGELSSC